MSKMTNMNYCRFENTVTDLLDCEDFVGDRNLSDDENKQRIHLIEICRRIAEQFVDIGLEDEFADNGEDDE